jgi:cell division protein FtsB
MENQKNNSSLKAIIVVLAILLAGSLAYMYKISSDAKTTETALVKDKDTAMEELTLLKTKLDAAIAENTSVSDELIAEREKVVKLMADLEKSKGDVASLKKIQAQYNALNSKFNALVKENGLLKDQNMTLVSKVDSLNMALGEKIRFNDTLVIQNENLAKTVEKASKLVVMNLRTQAIKEKSSGREVVTERARRADKLKVCFSIAQNEVAQSGDKLYYVQIIDSKNNVLGEKKVENFEGMTLTYSFTTTVAYENKSVDVCESLDNNGVDFEKGTYFVNIFDKGILVSKTSFTLK